MIDAVVYNIPISMLGSHYGRNIIVRSSEPTEIVEGVAVSDLDRVAYVQVLTVRADLHPLMLWGDGISIDLVVRDPKADLPLLYQCSQLLTRHPVRITIPVVPGFSQTVKLAVSLHFAVKLEIAQPQPALIDELFQVVHAYLHQPLVSQPIEYFHSMFLAFYRGEHLTLWTAQEEDPTHIRYITDDGVEIISKRFAGAEVHGDIALFPGQFRAHLVAAGEECAQCEFLDNCSGYFKWPARGYRCDGIKALFQTLKNEAHQLRRDLEAYHSTSGGERS